MKNKIIQGDCLEKLKELEENSVDSIVTDPPYELGFMGKSWDNTGIANNPKMWAECLRVLKPGGHLLAFSGTRTYHRMASAIEDAGFEVRDMIEWVYGSGFPKSLNIGKAVDKRRLGSKFQEFREYLKECILISGKTHKEITEYLGRATGSGLVSHWTTPNQESMNSVPNWEDYKKLKQILPIDSRFDDLMESVEREIIGEHPSIKGNGSVFNVEFTNGTPMITAPATEQAKQWGGWGTALKPAHEPICMARKPLVEKTVAENVLKYGTGGINIDDSRVETSDKYSYPNGAGGNSFSVGEEPDGKRTEPVESNSLGRFPANLIHDNSEEVRECFPETKTGGKIPEKKDFDNSGVMLKKWEGRPETINKFANDSGNASRFFKSIKKDLQYSPKHAILKLCENNISVNNAENNLKTTSQIELVANIFSALKSATPNLDLLNQNLNALFVEKSADSTEIDFVAKCVAIKELPEELVSQQEYTVFQDFMEDYKKCSLTQNPVSAEKWGNTDITQIMTSLLKLSGYVLAVIEENISSENQEGQKCDYRSLVYIPKASKSERNKGCEGLEVSEKFTAGNYSQSPTCKDCNLTLNGTNNHSECSGEVYYKEMESKNTKNNHPTVKPIALMEYLIKMVTPKGGIVLDPFAGSGSTLVAAKQNGFQYIGIEMTEEYIPIIEARLTNTQ